MFCTIESNPSLSLDTNSSVEYSIHSWRGQGTQCGVQSHAGQCVEVTSMANRLTRLPKNAKWCPGACSNCIQENVQQKLKKCKVMPRCWLQYAVNAGEGKKRKRKGWQKAKMITGLMVMPLTWPCPSVPEQFSMGPQALGFPSSPSQYANTQKSAPIPQTITTVLRKLQRFRSFHLQHLSGWHLRSLIAVSYTPPR